MSLQSRSRIRAYDIVDMIGGGIGEVSRAHDGRSHRDVAFEAGPFSRDGDHLAAR